MADDSWPCDASISAYDTTSCESPAPLACPVARVSTTAFSRTECTAGAETFPGGSALIQCRTAASTSPAQMWHSVEACASPASARRPARTPARVPHSSAGAYVQRIANVSRHLASGRDLTRAPRSSETTADATRMYGRWTLAAMCAARVSSQSSAPPACARTRASAWRPAATHAATAPR